MLAASAGILPGAQSDHLTSSLVFVYPTHSLIVCFKSASCESHPQCCIASSYCHIYLLLNAYFFFIIYVSLQQVLTNCTSQKHSHPCILHLCNPPSFDTKSTFSCPILLQENSVNHSARGLLPLPWFH